MHFSKKLAFLQYWVNNKKPNRTNSSSLGYCSNSNLELYRSNANMPFCSISSPNYLFSKTSQKCSVLSKKNLYNDYLTPHNYLLSNIKINELSLKLDSNVNITKSQVSITKSLPEQKPWYAYWVLPFVGFIFVLPSFIPVGKIDSSYGFKYLNSSSFLTSSSLKKCLNIKDVKDNKDFYIANKTEIFKPIIGNNISFSNNIWQYSNDKERSKSLFLYRQEDNIPQNINYKKLTKLTNKINIFSLSLDSKNTPKNGMQLTPNTNAIVLASANTKKGYFNNIITNDIIFTQKQNSIENISSLSESINFKDESAIKVYKKYQQYIDVLIKKLIISCDQRFIQAIQDLEFFIDRKKTNNILVFFKQQILNFNKQHYYKDEQSEDFVLNLTKVNLKDQNKNKRFLETYNESLFFYRYLNNIVFSKSKKPQVISLKGPLLKSSYSLNNEHNITNVSQTWVNRSSLDEQSDNLIRLRTKELTRNNNFDPSKLDNLSKLSYLNYLITNKNNQINYKLSSEVLNYKNSNLETIISSQKDKTDQSGFLNLIKTNSQEKLKNYLNFIHVQLLKSIQQVKYLKNKNKYISSKITLIDKNKMYLYKVPVKRIKAQILKNPVVDTTSLAGARRTDLLEIKTLNSQYLLQVRKRIRLYQDIEHVYSSEKSQEQIMRNSLISIYIKQNKSKKVDLNSISSKNILNGPLITHLNKNSLFNSSINIKTNKYRTKHSLIESSKNPLDILRLKHFIFLHNYEKNELKTFKNLEAILKDEKVLYETATRQAQKQKRRKKKRKRWTRRRRKRKRKLLRPLWSTIRLMHKYYAKRLPITSVHPTQINLTKSKIFNDFELYKSNLINADKNLYLLSKKTLQELTGTLVSSTLVNGNLVSSLKNSKLTSKRTLKNIEFYNIQKAKKLLNKKILQLVNFKNHNKNWRIQKHSISSIVGTTTKLNNIVEYNRIMNERIQRLLINNATTKDSTNLVSSYKDQTKVISDSLNTNLSNLLKLNISRNKIIYNEPKEEWMWLFKYITGEIPRYPILSKEDQVRSIWALNKSNYINQWTGWKNFYYQEFKKGITPKYELWQDKKPDKRYNVNNLKKRQYKYFKTIQRLRIFPQLKRGSYFALRRDFDKLRALGVINQQNMINKTLEISKSHKITSKYYNNSRPVDHLRETLKKLKKLATLNKLTRSKIENFNYLINESKQSVSKFGIYYEQKPIMDINSNWWELSNNGWSWKTIQYGAPWDRKTLYIPTKISNKNLLNPPPGHSKNIIQNTFFGETKVDVTKVPIVNANLKAVIIGTILLHICAILALVSLAELRYTSKVNIVLFYKLSSIPFKIISSFIEPLFKSSISTINKQKNSLYFSYLQNKSNKGQFINSTDFLTSSIFKKDSIDRLYNYRLQNYPIPNGTALASAHPKNTNILKFSKISFYFVLKEIIKKPLRQNLQHQASLKKEEKNKYFKDNINQIFVNYIFKSQPLALKALISFSSLYLIKSSVNLSLWGYYSSIKLLETSLDSIRESARSIYDFFSLPENFSPNPDEVGLDVLANFIYDFEEPLIELLPDIIETQFEKYFNRCMLTLSILGPPGILLQYRMNWFYRIFVELFYKADADYLRDEQELQILYTIWADILIKAAEELDLEATVIASQEDQRLQLLDHLLNSTILESTESLHATNKSVKWDNIKNTNKTSIIDILLNTFNKQTKDQNITSHSKFSDLTLDERSECDRSAFERLNIKSKLLINKLEGSFSSSKTNYYEWSADQYLLYKTDETDLFLEINTPKSFSHIRSIKYCDTLHQPIGTAVCQMYSGIFIKQMAKNILIIGENTSEKSTIIQALAGETELKLILDNSSRYASVSQSVAVGMRMLRDVFEAVALQTPCIFVLEDIHLIGEKRPFLISDEDLALVTNSGLGLEQHQLYEKNQKIQQHSKHRISYFKKAYRGENSESLPTNLLCYDLFLKQLPRTEWTSPNYPLALDFHSDIDSSKLSFDISGNQYSQSSDQYKSPNSHLAIYENSTNLGLQGEPVPKVNHLVNETSWSSKPEETFSKKNELVSIRTKVSTLADMSLANVSVKLDRITQLLVIMDNVRKNKGFIIFATTNKPQILDPALRRPGRLEETICFPSIPNLLNKWEILITNINHLKPTVSAHPNSKISSSKQFTLDLVQTFLINNKADFLFNQTNRASFSKQKQILYSNIAYKQELRKMRGFNITNNKSLIRNLLELTTIGRGRLSSSSTANKAIFTNAHTQTKVGETEVGETEVGETEVPVTDTTALTSAHSNSKGKNLKTNIIFPNELLVTSYENVGKQLIQIMYEQRTSNLLLSKISNNDNKISTVEEDIYMNLYSSKTLFKKELLNLFAGTVASYLATKKSSSMKSQIQIFNTKLTSGNIDFSGIDTTRTKEWQLATKLIYSYIQKRAIYNKNTYVHKLLNMKKGSLTTFPSPPTTSLLLPTKRYENYLRAEKEYEQTNLSSVTLSIQEKIDLHIAQRVLKRLYKLPIKELYKSEIIENSFTNFSSSTLTLPRESRNFIKHNKLSRTNFYYRNLFLKRHRNYLTNQWWNGHLTEYNIENTVMSEIDFRSCFVDKNILNGFVGDLVIDFPDADQHYNIKQRRWLLHSTSWKTWNDLEKGLSTDIISHYIFETFSRAYRILDQNRELLDNLVSKLMIKCIIQEIDTIENINNYI